MSQATLTFNEVAFSPVHQDSQLWIRASELAKALGYARADSISRIYDRNADEFTANMTQVIEIPDTVNLGTTGSLLNTVRVFSLRGCHLVAMFSRTPVAKEFRKWVLDVLDSLSQQATTTPTALTPSTVSDRSALKKLSDTWAKQTGQRYSQCYTQITTHFNLEAFAEIPVEWIPDAIAFVQSRLDEHQKALHSAQQKALPPATINLDKEARDFFEKLRDLEEKQTKERDVFNAKAIQPFFHLVYTHEWVFDEISEILRKTAKDAIADGHTWESHTQRAFKLIEKTLRLVH